MLISRRHALFAASLGLCALLSTPARATGAVLPAVADPAPSSVGMRIAIAANSSGTTRWSDVSLPEGSTIGWLVPVRPGAAVDWAPGPWLDALDDSTSPRILPPTTSSSCATRRTAEVPPGWTRARTRQTPADFSIQTTAETAKNWAKTHGFLVSAAQGTRVDELYASGWKVVAIELASSDTGRTSATLRVSDDGGPVLPLTLTGQPTTQTELTVFVIGAGVASIEGTRDIDPAHVLWGQPVSTYATYRENLVSNGYGTVWLRESASHDALFLDDASAGTPANRSVVRRYFDDADCAAYVGDLASRESAVDSTELTCGERTDLALALAGTAPVDAVVTRLVGVVPTGKLGRNVSVDVGPAEARPVAIRAGAYKQCDPPSTYEPPSYDPPSRTSSSGYPAPPSRGSQGGGSSPSYTDTGTIYVPSDGCSGGGGGTVVTSDDDDDDSDGDDTGWDISDADDDDDDDGWDTSDSSDSCSSDTSTDDGWDSSDSSTCSVVRAPKRRGRSPISRLALLAVALLLPLRRRLRPALPGDHR